MANRGFLLLPREERFIQRLGAKRPLAKRADETRAIKPLEEPRDRVDLFPE